MTAELNSIMSEKSGDSESEAPDQRWQINDNCVVKHGNNWVRAIIEEMKPDSDRCKVGHVDELQIWAVVFLCKHTPEAEPLANIKFFTFLCKR